MTDRLAKVAAETFNDAIIDAAAETAGARTKAILEPLDNFLRTQGKDLRECSIVDFWSKVHKPNNVNSIALTDRYSSVSKLMAVFRNVIYRVLIEQEVKERISRMVTDYGKFEEYQLQMRQEQEEEEQRKKEKDMDY